MLSHVYFFLFYFCTRKNAPVTYSTTHACEVGENVSVHFTVLKVAKIHKKFILLHSIHSIDLPHCINYAKSTTEMF